MGNRDYKLFAKDHYYHIYNRGNNKEAIFNDSSDFDNFIKRLKVCLGLGSNKLLRIDPFPLETFGILAYCLMDNHFHLLVKQCSDVSVDRLMSKLCTSYSKYFNKKYSRVGHVFQDTFKSRLVENDEHLIYLTAYIHNNPDDPYNYPYTSLKEYLLLPDFCNVQTILDVFQNQPEAYKKFLINAGFLNLRRVSS